MTSDYGGMHMKGKLKIALYICIGLFLFSTLAFADSGKEASLRVSYYAPEDAEPGFAFGGSFGWAIDEAVAISLGTDVYFKRYEKNSPVATEEYESGISSTTVIQEVLYRSIIIPIMLEVKINFNINGPLSIFGHGGIGYEILWVKEENVAEVISNNMFFSGFSWIVGAGPSFKLGSDSFLFVEGFYNGAKVRRNRKDITADLPVFEEVDLSGFGVRAGISFVTF
jgi:hypothetical protein